MHASCEVTDRFTFADRLGLGDEDLSRLPCSKVVDAVTVFYDIDGKALGEFTRQMHPFAEEDVQSFLIYGELLTAPADDKLPLS